MFRLVQARPHTLFQLLTDPQRHAQLDGSGMLRGDPVGSDRLQLGDIFTMAMSQGRKAYRSTNEVVEFEPDRRIAWRSTGTWRGHLPVGGQRWRYILHPDRAGTRVEHAYVWGYARMPLLTVWLPGFPRRMRPAMERSLDNLAALADRREPKTVSTGKPSMIVGGASKSQISAINMPAGAWPSARPMDWGSCFVLAVALLAGLFMTAAGVAALLAPIWFADAAGFPRHTHFVHDAGAFQLGIGVTLLLAVVWRDGLALVLAGFLVANTTHAINHAVDLDLGGHSGDRWGLAALSLLTGVALVVRLGQLGWLVGEVTTTTSPALARFVRQKTVLVTTYRRNGRPVGTPVSLAVDGDHGYLRTFEKAGKTRRINNNPRVDIAPSTARGRPTGPALQATARRLEGAEAQSAARLLTHKHPLLHGLLVPLTHRLGRAKTGKTVHFQLTPRDPSQVRG